MIREYLYRVTTWLAHQVYRLMRLLDEVIIVCDLIAEQYRDEEE